MSTNLNNFAQYYQSSLIQLASGSILGTTMTGVYDNTIGLYPACDVIIRLVGKTSYEGRYIDITIPKLYLPPAKCFIGTYVYFDNPPPVGGSSWDEFTQSFTTLNVRTVLQPSMYPETPPYPTIFAAGMQASHSNLSTIDTLNKGCNNFNIGPKSFVAPVNDGFEIQFTSEIATLNILPYTLSL